MEQIHQFFTYQPMMGAAALIAVLLAAWSVYYAFRGDRRAEKEASKPKQPPEIHIEQSGQGSVGVVEGSITQNFNASVKEDKK